MGGHKAVNQHIPGVAAVDELAAGIAGRDQRYAIQDAFSSSRIPAASQS